MQTQVRAFKQFPAINGPLIPGGEGFPSKWSKHVLWQYESSQGVGIGAGS